MLIRQMSRKNVLLCHYWYFLNKNFSYGPYLCDGCYNIAQKSISFENIAIVHVEKSAYRTYFQDMNKREAKKLVANSNLIDKKGIYKNLFYFFKYIKMDNKTYYQRKIKIKRENKQKINIKTYQKKIKIKKENMEKIHIIICLKKKSKN